MNTSLRIAVAIAAALLTSSAAEARSHRQVQNEVVTCGQGGTLCPYVSSNQFANPQAAIVYTTVKIKVRTHRDKKPATHTLNKSHNEGPGLTVGEEKEHPANKSATHEEHEAARDSGLATSEKLGANILIAVTKRGMVKVKTAYGFPITVHPIDAFKFLKFFALLKAHGYKVNPNIVGCDSPGGHTSGSNHHIGRACDNQWARNKAPAYMYHVGALIRQAGLYDGCSFRDCGHVEAVRGLHNRMPNLRVALEKFKSQLLTDVASVVAPVQAVVTAAITPVQVVAKTTATNLTNFALYAYNEYLPEKPANLALASLGNAPEGSARQEALLAADAFGLDHKFILAVAQVESDFSCHQTTGRYKGLFQLSSYEFNANLGGDGIIDCRRNAMAAASKFVTEKILFEHAVGREATFEDMYLVHQQGLGGAVAHLTHPERIAWKSMCTTDEGQEKGAAWCRKAIWGNTLPALKARAGSVEKLTSGDFVAHWNKRVGGLIADVDANGSSVRTASAKPTHTASAKRHHHHHYVRHRHHHVMMASR